jgi:formate hydrogenlyase subunit 6/NADH:ubiquinone oxidoreductase subunit I
MSKKNLIKRVLEPFVVVAKHVSRPPITHKYPIERMKGYERTRGRHILYLDLCTGCGICAWACPDLAIEMVPVEGRELTHPQIDYGKCSFCGFCVDYCPTHALKETPITEIASFTREGLIYDPIRLSQEPDIKELLPELKYELNPIIDRKYGIRYARKRVK